MRHNTGNFVMIALMGLNVMVWLVFPPANHGEPDFLRRYIGEILGSNNIVLMAYALFLSTRPRWAEKFFGGLDKMYIAHRRAATTAFLLIFVHVLTVPISANWRLGNYLAVIAFAGIVATVLVTLAPRISYLSWLTGGDYEGWKKLKRFIGIFFILAFIHSLTVDALDARIAITWTMIFFIIGTVSYLYTEIFGRYLKKYRPYTVTAVKHPNQFVTEVTMHANQEPIKRQRAGQFLFVSFPGNNELNESHPFTISSAPAESVLRLTIKASGDFTRALFANLREGNGAVIEGAYGMFDYKTGGPKQIWIAGGIGLTPFLAFIRDMNGNLAHDVDFYYTVRSPEEALFVAEIRHAESQNARLKAHIRASSVDGSLTIDEIVKNAGGSVRGHHLYLCGPFPMMVAFEKKFLEQGMPKANIHYEEFNLR